MQHPHYTIVEAAIRYLQARRGEQPSLAELGTYLHLSKFHLQRVFKEWAGITPKQFLQYLTVEHSKELLRLGAATLTVAYDVGLSSNSRLHDLFIKCEAMSPGEFKQQGAGLTIHWQTIDSPFGRTLVAETPVGISKVAFGEERSALAELKKEYPNAQLLQRLGPNGRLLQTYFQDWQTPEQKIGLHLRGTPFQLQVWRALLRIPAGRLVTYKDIGTAIDRPKAGRAVGTAIGSNPIAYLIPCHRVIRGDGTSGGYRWQPERKGAINLFEANQFNK